MRRSQYRWPILRAAPTLVLVAMALSARGQVHDVTEVADNNRPDPYGIAIPDSPGAVELLKKAGLEESKHQWEDAADSYQKAISQFADRVVLVQKDAGRRTSYYSGVAQIVQEKLARWPEEGQTIYTGMCGQAADELLKAAPRGNLGALTNIYLNYFSTEAGKAAGIRLMDAYLERGDFRAASWIGERLISLHPALGKDVGMIVYRTALAHHYFGDEDSARRLFDKIKKNHSSDLGCVGGKDVQLVYSLAEALSAPPLRATTRPSDADTFPSFGGCGSRGEISPSAVKFGGSRKSVQFDPTEYPGSIGRQLAALQASDRFDTNDRLASAIIPAADDGSLFFQDGRSLYAIDSNSGEPLPAWLRTYPGQQNGRYRLSAFGRTRNELLTVTVSPSVVLAVMGQADRLPLADVSARDKSLTSPSTVKLVCLDRDTGREIWARTPAELPSVTATLNKAEYDGTPVIIPATFASRDNSGALEDSVVITARSGAQNQFDECYLICLSLKSGQYRWSTYLGGATHDIKLQREPSQVAFADGRVFVTTSLGAVASIDPSSGHIIWLNSYQRTVEHGAQSAIPGNGQQNRQRMGLSAAKAWAHNPVVVFNGTVFVLPSDSAMVLIYDAETGLDLNQIPLSEWDDADVLLGVRDGLLLLNSARKVFAIDWRKYNAAAPSNDAALWSADISFVDNSTTSGRGFLTSDSIFVPTTNRLVQIKKGRIKAVFPKEGILSAAQAPGAMLATSKALMIVGQTQVDIYIDPISEDSAGTR